MAIRNQVDWRSVEESFDEIQGNSFRGQQVRGQPTCLLAAAAQQLDPISAEGVEAAFAHLN
jgi:hypothetical protein